MQVQKMTPARILLGLLGLALAVTLTLTGKEADSMRLGKVELKSVGALAFGPAGVLFVADSQGGAVWAIDVGDPPTSTAEFQAVEDLDQKIGAMLGTGARDISIQDLAVQKGSGRAFISVMRGRGDDARPVILTIGRGGKIAELVLDQVRHSRLVLNDLPKADAKVYKWESRSLTVTDLEFIDSELFIAGLSNEEFASVLRRVPYPFSAKTVATGLEIFHGAHGQWETFAPIFSFAPYEIAGKTHLLAGYLCTPLVTFPLDELRASDRMRGKTIAELGFGNIPTDIVVYEKGGQRNVLINNSSRGVMRLKQADIEAAAATDGITARANPGDGVEIMQVPLGAVAQVADYDADNLLMLGRSLDNGALRLATTRKF